jgi:hypothetical protein
VMGDFVFRVSEKIALLTQGSRTPEHVPLSRMEREAVVRQIFATAKI